MAGGRAAIRPEGPDEPGAGWRAEATQRLKERARTAELGAHLARHYGVDVTGVSRLDLGVFRVDLRDGGKGGGGWVARVSPALRPAGETAHDASVLRWLEGCGFPAESLAHEGPISELAGQAVLVTNYVEAVPRDERLAAARRAGGAAGLGEVLGRLQVLPNDGAQLGASNGAINWPGGAWHHLADGAPEEEVAGAAGLLAESEDLVPPGQQRLYHSLARHAEALDAGAGLPEAVVHPDFAPANLVFPVAGGRPVIVDWTGTGIGPRVWSLGFLLIALAARDIQRVDRALAGYRRHVELGGEELARLAGVARTRPTVLAVWAFAMGRKPLSEALATAERAAELASVVSERAGIAYQSGGKRRRSPARPSGGRGASPVRDGSGGRDGPGGSGRPGHSDGRDGRDGPGGSGPLGGSGSAQVVPAGGGQPRSLAEFDANTLWSALDAKRRALELSWKAVADEIWDLSRELNDRRRDHPIAISTVSNMAKRGGTSCQHALFMLRWLGRPPEDFLREPDGRAVDAKVAKGRPLPQVGPDRRLRWDLRLLHAELATARRARGLTWAELASELQCTPSQLTGLKDAKFATGMGLAMRVVQWMDRPAADFVYPAKW